MHCVRDFLFQRWYKKEVSIFFFKINFFYTKKERKKMTKLGKCRRVFGESKDFTAVQQNTHADRDETRREKRTKNRFFIFVSQKRSFFLATPGNFRPRAPAIKKKENEMPRGRGVV